jgi:acyl carrier protein
MASVAPRLQSLDSPALTSTPLASSVTSVAPEDVPPGSLRSSRKDRIASHLLDLLVPLSAYERSQISTSATFLEQGFDSLSLTQVAFAIRKEFSAKVSFTQLMNQLPNVDMLAEHLDLTLPGEVLAEAPVTGTAPSMTSAGAVARDADTPPKNGTLEEAVAAEQRTAASLGVALEKSGTLSARQPAAHFAAHAAATSSAVEVESTVPQRGIYASARLSERLSAAYNESMTLRFTGTISIEKMTRAMERLVGRHDALRASFDEPGLVMKIAPAPNIALPVTDLSWIKESIPQEEQLRNLIADETALPFRLPEGPLFRCQMVLLAPDRAAVIFTAHHVICDGWSLDVLIHDLCALYSEELSGTPASFEKANGYVDYVQSVTHRHRSEEFKKAGEYWHSKFKDGLPVLLLPTDHPRTARREFGSRRLDHAIPSPVVQNLKAMGAKQGCSFFAVLLSSYAILLARVSQQRRFVIALPTAEQPVIGQPGLVGHCVNLLPFAVELREGETVSAFLERVHVELLAAHDHAAFTMISLLEDLHPVAGGLGISSISAGLTNVKRFKPHELPQSGFTVDYDANPKSYESFELYFNAVESGDDLELRCHYDLKLFEQLTIREWFSTLDSIFEDIPADPSRQVLDLARLNPSDAGFSSESSRVQAVSRRPVREFLSTVVPSKSERSQQLSTSSWTTSTTPEPSLVSALLPLWQHVLDIREVGPDDDFFALGGHSIAAAQLSSLIERELGLIVPLATLYDAATPRMLAEVLNRGKKVESCRPVMASHGSCDKLPLRLAWGADDGRLLDRTVADHLDDNQPVLALQGVADSERSAADGQRAHGTRGNVDEIGQAQPRDSYLQSPPLTMTRNDWAIRPFVEDDIPQVADLWWTILRSRKAPAPPAVRSYFHELYFTNRPWIDSALPSLVYKDKSGEIVGFLGVIRRKMSLRGQSIRVAVGGNFAVQPAARNTPAALRLLATYMAGDQDLSLADSANDASRTIMHTLGFRTIAPFNVHWARPLRPAQYAVHAMSSVFPPVLSAGLKFAAKPFCTVVDGVGARLPFVPFRQSESPLRAAALDVDTHLQCLSDSRNGVSLYPEYDHQSLESLLTFMETMHSGFDLRNVVLRDDKEKVLGWYIYYVNRGGVGQVVQIGGERKFTKDVLDHLFYDAWKHGAIALHGLVRNDLMPEFHEKNCFFTCRGGWTLAHSRNSELLELLDRGDASLSRLDGEWCLGYES